MTFADEAEAVLIVDSTEYGLAAGLWTSRPGARRAHRLGPADRNCVGEHLQPVRSGDPVRRARAVRYRA
jgi:hypothetical protein